jgi:VanZ family protein
LPGGVTGKRVWLWLPAVIYMGIIFYLSAQPDPLPNMTGRVWDKGLHLVEYKGLHLVEYAALAVLFCRALRGEGLEWLATAAIAVTATSLYGASDEWHQAFVPFRNSSILDWYADLLGAVLGAAGYATVVSMVSRSLRRFRR